MILLGSPMGERDLVRTIIRLTAFALLLSIVTSALTWLV
jgi:hypothetical protein